MGTLALHFVIDFIVHPLRFPFLALSLVPKIDNLRAGVKSASAKLAQTERQLAQLASRKVGKNNQGVQPKPGQSRTTTTAEAVHEMEGGAALEREATPVDSQAWYQLEMLRAQHGVLMEDLEKSDTISDGAEDLLRDTSLLTAACWQLRDEGPQASEAKQDGDAALELAAVAVAADLTSTSSDLAEKILDTFDWEVRSREILRTNIKWRPTVIKVVPFLDATGSVAINSYVPNRD